jgi:tRNA (guanine37-N1)-methyltransferase
MITKIGIITLFPEVFENSLCGVTGKFIKENNILKTFNIRDFAHKGYIDDTPYGGGPGMLMKAEPLFECLEQAKKVIPKATVILMSPRGAKLTQPIINNLAKIEQMILICGRYEGIDQRFIDSAVDMEISIGDFILSGGEIAAMSIIDACIRLQEGALGSIESIHNESFNSQLLEHDQYTKPRELLQLKVPKELLSGNHQKIKTWKRINSLGKTWQKRPDLLDKDKLSKQDIEYLNEFKSQIIEGDKNE